MSEVEGLIMRNRHGPRSPPTRQASPPKPQICSLFGEGYLFFGFCSTVMFVTCPVRADATSPNEAVSYAWQHRPTPWALVHGSNIRLFFFPFPPSTTRAHRFRLFDPGCPCLHHGFTTSNTRALRKMGHPTPDLHRSAHLNFLVCSSPTSRSPTQNRVWVRPAGMPHACPMTNDASAAVLNVARWPPLVHLPFAVAHESMVRPSHL